MSTPSPRKRTRFDSEACESDSKRGILSPIVPSQPVLSPAKTPRKTPAELEREAPRCKCDKPLPILVSHTVRNPDREFRTCRVCRHFNWVDQEGVAPSTAADASAAPKPASPSKVSESPLCDCGQPSQVSVAGPNAKNAGKEYRHCPTRTCNFFEFVAPEDPLRCYCGRPARLLIAGSNAEAHNVGVQFGICPKPKRDPTRCDLWKWCNGTRWGAKPLGHEAQARFDSWADARFLF